MARDQVVVEDNGSSLGIAHLLRVVSMMPSLRVTAIAVTMRDGLIPQKGTSIL